jgi:uncharacterized protein YjbJ (UPF0337 family)
VIRERSIDMPTSTQNTSTPTSAEDLKGRIKEAAGDLTGNDSLKHEGRVEQASEKLKHGIDKAADKAKELLSRD